MQFSYNSNIAQNFSSKPKRRKFGVSSLLIMVFIGVVCIAIGVFMLQSTKIDPSWVHTNGKVTSAVPVRTSNSSSMTYAPIISYTVAGQSYSVTSSTSSSIMPATGSTREVAYDPAMPANAMAVDGTTVKVLLYIFPAIGVLFVIAAPIAFVRGIRRSHDISSLQTSGIKTTGVITEFGGGNNSEYFVVVTATDASGGVRNFKSDPMAGIGGLAMADFRSHPIPVDVYVDPSNSDNYYVDISDLPNLTPERIASMVRSVLDERNGSGSNSRPSGPIVG